MKKLFLITAIMSLMLMAVVFAASEGGDEAEVTAVETRAQIAGTTGSVDVVAGNITVANLESNRSTYRWAALIGNASGNILLGDDFSNILHTWTATAVVVYASEAASVTWGSLVAATDTNMPAYLTDADSDNYSLTFDTTGTGLSSGVTAIAALTPDTAFTYNSAGADTWETNALYDGSATVFAVDVSANGDSYAGDTVDYQLLVPEDGTSGNAVATTYNVWLELR